MVGVVDVADESACATLPEQIGASLGGVDILVNNVGILGNPGVVDTSPDFWDSVMGVNLRGMWLTTRAVVPLMVAQNTGGSVVNMSSIWGIEGGSTFIQRLESGGERTNVCDQC